jgi:hypothetical protein
VVTTLVFIIVIQSPVSNTVGRLVARDLRMPLYSELDPATIFPDRYQDMV